MIVSSIVGANVSANSTRARAGRQTFLRARFRQSKVLHTSEATQIVTSERFIVRAKCKPGHPPDRRGGFQILARDLSRRIANYRRGSTWREKRGYHLSTVSKGDKLEI